jgi:hypothetical protein
MALAAAFLPFSSQLDPTEEPPSGLDPLGTFSGAERLADVLLPGFTGRMWRPRLVTFATIAAEVAQRVAQLLGREDLHLPARLAFERLYVAAMVRAERQEDGFGGSTRTLPGRLLAAAALEASEPLSPRNFLRGQAVNGPSGVVARMARKLGLVDDRWIPATSAPKVLVAWAQDRGLAGVLDEHGSSTPGGAWMSRVVKHTVAHLTKSEWPGPSSQIWTALASNLRPDRTGARERAELGRLLDADPVRRRVLALVAGASGTYDATASRGEAERAVLLDEVRGRLGRDPLDQLIAAVVSAVEAYEDAAALFEQAFDALRWGLRGTGHATAAKLVKIPEVARLLATTHSQLPRAAKHLEDASALLRATPALDGSLADPLSDLRGDALRGDGTPQELVSALLDRHEAVQRSKRKGVWIDRSERLTLMPNFGVGGDAPSSYEGSFRHPYRILNALAFLAALKRTSAKVDDAET